MNITGYILTRKYSETKQRLRDARQTWEVVDDNIYRNIKTGECFKLFTIVSREKVLVLPHDKPVYLMNMHDGSEDYPEIIGLIKNRFKNIRV